MALSQGLRKDCAGPLFTSPYINRPPLLLIRLTDFRPHPYSYGMISEFIELSDKIDRLAELTLSLRAENTQLRQWNAQVRQSNAQLFAEKEACMVRLNEVQRRVEGLLAQMPDPNAVTVASVPAAQTEEAQ